MYIVKRFSHNPLLAPVSDRSWEARATFNGCPIRKDNLTYLLYRAVSKPDPLISAEMGLSTIGKAISLDDQHFTDRRQLIVPEAEWERFGCEDPRVTFFEGRYYIFYTALSAFPPSASGIKVGLAISDDLETIQEKHLITPFNAKAMALFPERIKGKIVAVLTAHTDEPPAKIAIVTCDRIEDLFDEPFWKKWYEHIDTHRVNPLRSHADHVEVGAPPIKTKWGWLLLYSYIQNYFFGEERVFGIEAMLLDSDNPHNVLARTKGPIMVSEESYERYGATPNVVFPSGALLYKNNRLDIYYGAADTTCAKASVDLSDLVASFHEKSRSPLLTRRKENPILSPRPEHPWEAKAVFNPGAMDIKGEIHLLYRAMGEDNTSVLGHARSDNGLTNWKRDGEPAYVPREDFEKKHGNSTSNSGCEDPRLTHIGGTVYMTYTAFDGVRPTRVALSTISTKNLAAGRFDCWSQPIAITPEQVDDKNMCLLPKKINGQYMLFHRIGRQICGDFLHDLDFTQGRVSRCVEIMGPRPGMWDSIKIGIAAPPLETKEGWLLIYHGVSKTTTYRLGTALLDKKNPSIVIARSAGPIFEPTEPYERTGQVQNVVFSCGAVIRGDTLFVYYGGADRVIGVATGSVKKILAALSPKSLRG